MSTSHAAHGGPSSDKAHKGSAPYVRLLVMAAIHFAAMYVLMYAMVDRIAYAVPNFNQVYMAALMTAPMLIIELLLMGSMYPSSRWTLALLGLAALVAASAFLFIRQQTAIGDAQFLRSMIPHHSGAILMCRQASLQDPEIRQLCAGIERGQQEEIDWMRARLEAGAKP